MIKLYSPHETLGLHEVGQGKVIRLWRPGAEHVHLEVWGKVFEAHAMGEGLFEFEVPRDVGLLDYRIYHGDGRLGHDPYAFWPTFGEVDAHLFNAGVHYELYKVLGGRITYHQGCVGAKFAVWAPGARSVALVGDINGWDGSMLPMRSMGVSGVWELFVPGMTEGELYKFEIMTEEGAVLIKSDPYALYAEQRPHTASRLFDIDQFKWSEWKGRDVRAIYEVHLGSWRRGLSYRELAHQLSEYCVEMGFSHVEILPIMEHPLDESWGYQVTGFFAATSRFGTPRDFQYFVNHMHEKGIGVILDWVPGHFPVDTFALSQFDGTYLYEHADPRQGFHPHWNTSIFNFGRKEVSNFLIASALFWLDVMHVDGLRVDAVASMLYLDYGRSEWIPNVYGGRENLEAIEFLKHLNSIVHERFPQAIMCAEESTSFPGVTSTLGFNYKWNMGWMNDTLRYFHKDPIYRHYHQDDLTFGLIYAFSEKFILVLSHDEVVHGKGSLLSKMPGDDWQKFANLRLLYSYMICQPGKKLLFMGGELGQWSEWSSHGEIAWHLLQYDRHQYLQKCIRDLNHLYKDSPALWHDESDGFEWVDFRDAHNSVLIYLRKGKKQSYLCIHNFTPNTQDHYFVKFPGKRQLKEVMNTDRQEYGGSGKTNGLITAGDDGFHVKMAPLATLIFAI
jgi:1,4-alpha-glucan branching enzyme